MWFFVVVVLLLLLYLFSPSLWFFVGKFPFLSHFLFCVFLLKNSMERKKREDISGEKKEALVLSRERTRASFFSPEISSLFFLSILFLRRKTQNKKCDKKGNFPTKNQRLGEKRYNNNNNTTTTKNHILTFFYYPETKNKKNP